MAAKITSSRIVGDNLIVETDSGSETYGAGFIIAALLVFVAKGGGEIEPEETAQMIDLLEEHFGLKGAETLELLTHAMAEMADKPGLGNHLARFGRTMSDTEKEELAVMALKVIAADGRRDMDEIENFNTAIEAMGITPEIKHRAFDRYFQETMPGF